MNSSAATTMKVFAAYLLGLGVVFLVIPNVLLSIFGLPPTNEVWIRGLGMVVLFLSAYYYQMGQTNNRVLMMTTVYTRSTVPLFLLAFVVFGFAPINLMLFAAPDFLAAMWTWYALRNEDKANY